jgi:DNA polymerase-4
MPEQPRAIIHLDLDAFFAAVEVLKEPELTGKPLLIGGRPAGRGVVAAASYPARAFGIHSAMPMARALVLCPEAIVRPVRRRSEYREFSTRVMGILRQSSRLVEQVSIDEAYIDLTDQLATWDEAIRVAEGLQRRISKETRLSASLGVATNKLLAKVASDQDKPGGLTVVRPGDEAAFLAPLPVRVLWGVGPVTAEKLAQMDVTTVGDLAGLSEESLWKGFGRHGPVLARMARGIDERPVVTEYEPKSVSHERTFSRDLADARALRRQLWRLSQGVGKRLRRREVAGETVAIKLRYADFTTLTRQTRLSVPTDNDEEIYQAAVALLRRTWQPGRPVRLLGVAARGLTTPAGQIRLWEDENE